MTIDPTKIREIARVCAALSKSAPSAEERDIFANLASKWRTVARDRETQLAIDFARFEDDGGAPSVVVEGPSFYELRPRLSTKLAHKNAMS